MKRFSRIAVTAFALLIPTLASAQTPFKMVYRQELRAMVPVYATTGAPIELSRREQIARHEAMAQAYRANASRKGIADPAVHCDRLVAELRSAEFIAR